MSETHKPNIPTVLVIFGATGDLVKKKIVPSLYHLYKEQQLPKMFQVVGYSRRAWTDEDFRRHVSEILDQYQTSLPQADRERFLGLFSYQRGEFNQAGDYTVLAERLGKVDDAWRICTSKLFYLAVPPEFYPDIFHHLKESHLTDPCSPEEGWTRVLVEKPFGRDAATARQLDQSLAELFKEEQIYRIDHYLAKDMLENILAFRFSNNLFEETWNGKFIEKIEIRLLETIGAEDRGSFYDGVGALRDVGQNHLLQMLALVTMEAPGDFGAVDIRAQRAAILEHLSLLTEPDLKKATFRAQYTGFRQIEGVSSDSETETYFKLVTELDDERWRGTPITLEAGKRLGTTSKEIVVTFRHPARCLCPNGAEHYQNRIIFRLEPEEGIWIRFWAKKPGLDKMAIEERTLNFLLHEDGVHKQYVEEYGKLILDAIAGDQTSFVSTTEVAAMWRFTDPVTAGWQHDFVPLSTYQPNTDTVLALANEALKPALVDGQVSNLKKELGIIGLGKMGAGLARQLLEKDWQVVGYNRSADDTKALEADGLIGAYALPELVQKLTGPRVIWLMLPAGPIIDDYLFGEHGLVHLLVRGDIIIDGGNSFYQDSARRSEKLAEYGIRFLDVGVSGGPNGARHGASLMIGGDRSTYEQLEPLFVAIALPKSNQFFDGAGAGHFVKMIHNGIEYGMMQAIAEGFAILRASPYELDLTKVAEIYNHGSVIESRLVGWLKQAFIAHGPELSGVTGTVAHTGEGEWTVKTAEALEVETKVISEALAFRVLSEQNPNYTGQILSALREQFGGHAIK